MAKDYICPNCDHMFQVTNMKSIFAKRTKDGKMLGCPRCGKNSAFRD